MNDELNHTPPEIIPTRKDSDYIKGIASPIPYIINYDNGDSSKYFSPYTSQRYGNFDTSCCWDYSGIAVVQAELNYLKQTNQLSQEAVNWYQTNGYLDANGLFKLSPRFIGIVSGITDNGSDPWRFCELTASYGFLPLSDLDYSIAQANQFSTDELFDKDYFNPQVIMPAMYAKALKALSFVNFQYEYLSKIYTTMPPMQDIKASLCQSPLLVSIPIPNPPQLWNTTLVPAQPNNKTLSHCVALARVNPDGTYLIHDNYNPEWKTLSADYYIGEFINIVITPKVTPTAPYVPPPLVQPWYVVQWQAVLSWFAGR